MKYYLVEVWAYAPYKIAKTYRIERSSFGAALSEAVKNYRRDIGRKKITELSTKAVYITSKENISIGA